MYLILNAMRVHCYKFIFLSGVALTKETRRAITSISKKNQSTITRSFKKRKKHKHAHSFKKAAANPSNVFMDYHVVVVVSIIQLSIIARAH